MIGPVQEVSLLSQEHSFIWAAAFKTIVLFSYLVSTAPSKILGLSILAK